LLQNASRITATNRSAIINQFSATAAHPALINPQQLMVPKIRLHSWESLVVSLPKHRELGLQ
jgi:hypothetical protein